MDIDKFLNRKNMSVHQLAQLLGLKSDAGIYNYRYNKSKPSYEAIEKMLRAGATISEIFNEDVEEIVKSSLSLGNENYLEDTSRYADIVALGLAELAKRHQG